MHRLNKWLVRRAVASVSEPEPGRRSALMMEHGSMTLRWYAPRGHDPQSPHDQDELYLVAAGSGTFALGRNDADLERAPFGEGDAIFVPAGWVHRFEEFSDDFATWVIFWGPAGGEPGPD